MFQPLRPLHVGKAVPPPYAGIEAHVDTLLRCLGSQVEGTLVASQSVFQPSAVPVATPYTMIPVPSFGSIKSVAVSPGILSVVAREIAAGHANLLHLHAPNPWGDLAALALPRNVPAVMTWHSDVVQQKMLLKLYGGVQRRALQRMDRVIVYTPKHFESSRQLRIDGIERKLAFVPIGIDFDRLDTTAHSPEMHDRIDTWAQGRPLILAVGRHVYYKGFEYLLDAMTHLRSDAVLLMVGAGPLTRALKHRATHHGLDSRVLFVGEIDESMLVTAVQRCDVFTLPSIKTSESFGIASAEAMAFGKPAVVCELNNGVNYLNRANVTGFATPPRDARALADALDTLILDEALRTRMGNAAREWVRGEFRVDAMREGMLALYHSLM